MKLNLTIILTICILLNYSCKETKNSVLRDISFHGRKITEINLDNIPSEVREFKLSELFSDFQAIPLETRPECVIGNTKIKFSKDFIFVGTQNFPRASKLYRFSKNGSFINEYGKEGRGPGEHQGYMPAKVIPLEEDTLLLANWLGSNDNSQIFSLNGSVRGEVIQPLYLLGDIYEWSDNEWFSFGNCAGRPEFQRDSCKIIFYNNDGKILKIIPRLKYPNIKIEDFTPSGGFNSIYRYKNQWKTFIPGIDTIFKIVDKTLVPTEILIRGKNGMPYNSILAPDQLPGKFDLQILAETENNIFIQKHVIKSAETNQYKPGKWSVSIMPDYQLIIIDKISRKATYVKLKDDTFQFLSDDILTFRLEWTDNPRVFISVQATDYLKSIKDAKPVDGPSKEALRLKEELKGITENSNPVILTFFLKERIRID
jgi:hypothetical protein